MNRFIDIGGADRRHHPTVHDGLESAFTFRGIRTANADISYAELGSMVGLSALAVHDRVKKLRASGCLRGTVALLDAFAIGKPLLAFVHVDNAGYLRGSTAF